MPSRTLRQITEISLAGGKRSSLPKKRLRDVVTAGIATVGNTTSREEDKGGKKPEGEATVPLSHNNTIEKFTLSDAVKAKLKETGHTSLTRKQWKLIEHMNKDNRMLQAFLSSHHTTASAASQSKEVESHQHKQESFRPLALKMLFSNPVERSMGLAVAVCELLHRAGVLYHEAGTLKHHIHVLVVVHSEEQGEGFVSHLSRLGVSPTVISETLDPPTHVSSVAVGTSKAIANIPSENVLRKYDILCVDEPIAEFSSSMMSPGKERKKKLKNKRDNNDSKKKGTEEELLGVVADASEVGVEEMKEHYKEIVEKVGHHHRHGFHCVVLASKLEGLDHPGLKPLWDTFRNHHHQQELGHLDIQEQLGDDGKHSKVVADINAPVCNSKSQNISPRHGFFPITVHTHTVTSGLAKLSSLYFLVETGGRQQRQRIVVQCATAATAKFLQEIFFALEDSSKELVPNSSSFSRKIDDDDDTSEGKTSFLRMWTDEDIPSLEAAERRFSQCKLQNVGCIFFTVLPQSPATAGKERIVVPSACTVLVLYDPPSDLLHCAEGLLSMASSSFKDDQSAQTAAAATEAAVSTSAKPKGRPKKIQGGEGQQHIEEENKTASEEDRMMMASPRTIIRFFFEGGEAEENRSKSLMTHAMRQLLSTSYPEMYKGILLLSSFSLPNTATAQPQQVQKEEKESEPMKEEKKKVRDRKRGRGAIITQSKENIGEKEGKAEKEEESANNMIIRWEPLSLPFRVVHNALVQKKITALVRKIYTLNKSAFEAYKSYMTFYSLLRPKEIFAVEKLNLDQVAGSFGLETAPLLDLRTKDTIFRPKEDYYKEAVKQNSREKRALYKRLAEAGEGGGSV